MFADTPMATGKLVANVEKTDPEAPFSPTEPIAYSSTAIAARRVSDSSNSSYSQTASIDKNTNGDIIGRAAGKSERKSNGSIGNSGISGVREGGGISILQRIRIFLHGQSSNHAADTNNGDRMAEERHSGGATMDDDAQKRQNRKVCVLRGATISTLLAAMAAVATLTFVYVRNDEEGNFEIQYLGSVAKFADSFQHGVDTMHDAASTFSAVYTSRYGNDARRIGDHDHENNETGFISVWPNATMPDFQEQAEGQLKLSNGRALSFNPIITQDVNRLEWEAHAAKSAWILEDESSMTSELSLAWPDNRTVSFGIYSNDMDGNVIYDPGYNPGSNFTNVLVPIWQIAPIVTNKKAIMFNLHSEKNRQRALDDMLVYRVPALTAILQLVQDKELRPSSILFYPVFDEFNYEIDNIERNVVGSVSIVFSWDMLLASILPDYIKGMICVLRSSVDQEFSYSISGGKVTLLGEGDLHDPKYDHLGRTVKAHLGETRELLGEVDNLITFELELYPSQEFEGQYVTNRPAIYTGGVILIFLCTAALFLLYDYLVEDRQQKTARLAQQTGSIVDSMFPAMFRDRLYKSHNDNTPARRASSYSNADNRRRSDGDGTVCGSNGRRSTVSAGRKISMKEINKFMKNNMRMSYDYNTMDHSVVEDEPIAELFLDTSIMFSDIVGESDWCLSLCAYFVVNSFWLHIIFGGITSLFEFLIHAYLTIFLECFPVGFTKWSSERSPNEVFRLLEHLFWEFDEIAAKLNVFKLGTIGDCYIAVTGIPNPVEDHAIVLTQFAFECREKVREVKARLDAEGLDTFKLDMRFGIHSGAITAGILRGAKSRFELFGDTINTASRMESTGHAGRIQVSEETAELIRVDRKECWLVKRDELVFAKGKGKLQTYWVEPQMDENKELLSDVVDAKPIMCSKSSQM